MIPAYFPEARGQSERAFRTHQDRLPKELAAQGITTMDAANRYLAQVYINRPGIQRRVYAASCRGRFSLCALKLEQIPTHHVRTLRADCDF